VKRLVRTSRGWIELDLDSIEFAGFHVRVAVFHAEGWASAEETWNAKYPMEGRSFATFLADIARIPEDEAARIAEESIREWRERGGEREDRAEKRQTIAFLATTFGLAGIGALALLALVVLLAIRLT
jgi:hypothetical protein